MPLPHDRHNRRTIVVALALAAAGAFSAAGARTVRVLVQSSRLAGFVHDEAAAVFPELRVGDGLRHHPNPRLRVESDVFVE
jgi:hypothetical protein